MFASYFRKVLIFRKFRAVPPLPDAGALPANAKLPDPFKKLDGTRTASPADWTCRREEIKKLSEKFVYGEQPSLGDAFGSFTGAPTRLPVDTHEVVGMIAPRADRRDDHQRLERRPKRQQRRGPVQQRRLQRAGPGRWLHRVRLPGDRQQ